MDKLKDILIAVGRRNVVPNEKTNWPIIRLISFRTFSVSDYDRIRWFQKIVKNSFGVSLVAIGGGYGCTKISFAVEARTKEEALQFILDMMNSEEFRRLGVEAEFKVALCDDPYMRKDLKRGTVELSEKAKNYQVINLIGNEVSLVGNNKNITKIDGKVSSSNLAIGSEKNTLQLNYQPENKELIELLQDIYKTVASDQSLSSIQKQEALEKVEAATEEAKKETPKKSLLKAYAESLKSIESIGKSISKLLLLLGFGA